MAKMYSSKTVQVREDVKTSVKEAGLFPLDIPDGTHIAAFSCGNFPHHDRNLHDLILKMLDDTKPVIFMLGSMVDEEAFRLVCGIRDLCVNAHDHVPEICQARGYPQFEDRILHLGRSAGKYISSFAEVTGQKIFYIPATGARSIGSDIRIVDYVQQEKYRRDSQSRKWKESDGDPPSDPGVILPGDLAELLGIKNHPMIKMLPFGAACLVNDSMLFLVGDFTRRHPTDAGRVEWEQRLVDVVRSQDGRLSSAWFTTPDRTFPGLQLNFHEHHETGYLWDSTRGGQKRDYPRRGKGFFKAVVAHRAIFGHAVIVKRGTDNRRSFLVDGKAYTEATAGSLTRGHRLTLEPEPISEGQSPDNATVCAHLSSTLATDR